MLGNPGKQNSSLFLGNYWALLSIYGKLINASESTCFENKTVACFSDLKDEESFVRQTRGLFSVYLWSCARKLSGTKSSHSA